METKSINLEKVYEELIDLKKQVEEVKSIVEEDFELADDVVAEIEESRKRPEKEFISNEEMRKEFG